MYKIQYWVDKLPELKENLEPVNLKMIRTTGEVIYFSKKNKTNRKKIINSNDINILHTIDRKAALDKLENRIKFLKKNKNKINQMIRDNNYIDLTSDFFIESPFKSINHEILAKIDIYKNKSKYLTLSGVGRIAAIQSVFPNGVPLKINVVTCNFNLQKILVSINNLYIYSNRFNNLRKYKINVSEIIFKRIQKTKKIYRRKKYLNSKKKTLMHQLIPFRGGFND